MTAASSPIPRRSRGSRRPLSFLGNARAILATSLLAASILTLRTVVTSALYKVRCPEGECETKNDLVALGIACGTRRAYAKWKIEVDLHPAGHYNYPASKQIGPI